MESLTRITVRPTQNLLRLFYAISIYDALIPYKEHTVWNVLPQ